MIIDYILGIGIAVLAIIIISNLLSAAFIPIAQEILIHAPKIGDTNCLIPGPNAPKPALDFGSEGKNKPGCLELQFLSFGMTIAVVTGVLSFLWAVVKSLWSKTPAMKAVEGLGFSLFVIMMLPFTAVISDIVVGLINTGSTLIAAWPWELNGQLSAEQAASRTVTFPFIAMRDTDVLKTQCASQDALSNAMCKLVANLEPNAIARNLTAPVIGNLFALSTTASVFLAGVMKYSLTGVLEVMFPFIWATHRLPAIGKVSSSLIELLITLLMANILIAAFTAVTPSIINELMMIVRDQNPGDDSVMGYVAFFGLVGEAWGIIAIILWAARFMAGAIISASGSFNSAMMSGFAATTKFAVGAVGNAIGSKTLGSGVDWVFSSVGIHSGPDFWHQGHSGNNDGGNGGWEHATSNGGNNGQYSVMEQQSGPDSASSAGSGDAGTTSADNSGSSSSGGGDTGGAGIA